MTIMTETIASFEYNGERVALVPAKMQPVAPNEYEQVMPDGLRVHLTVDGYEGGAFAVMLAFEHGGDAPSGRIRRVRALDLTLDDVKKLAFHGFLGDSCGAESYAPLDFELAEGESRSMQPLGGRSSNTTAFPFFDVSCAGRSWAFGVGWSGQWIAEIGVENGRGHVRAGLAEADFYLKSGERVRTARVLCVPGEDAAETRRRFRRVMLEHFSPRTFLGADMTLPTAYQPFDLYYYSETVPWYQGGRRRKDWATEDGQKRGADAAVSCHMDTQWLDAGWFDVGFPDGVGNYSFAKGFPNGLRPVSDYARSKGLRFMLWFEPERVHKDTEVFREHRDMLLSKPGSDDYLFNLADERALSWLTDKLIAFIRDNGIDIYRQDFNFEPLPYWLAADEEGRRGVTEMKYVAGHYALWDALLAAFPALLIDNCASGGRRIDLETCRRAVPLWRSDTGCSPVSQTHRGDTWSQNHILALTQYIPFHACASWDMDAYSMRSAYSGGIACTFDLLNPDFDVGSAARVLDELKRTQPYWTNDFYPLTAPTNDEDCWAAWQLGAKDGGVICAFRRDTCPQETFEVRTQAIEADADYDVILSDEWLNIERRTLNGRALKSLIVRADRPRSSLLIEYKKR